MNTLADRIGGKRRVIGGPFGSNLTQKDYVAEGVPIIRGTNMEHHGRWIGGEFAFVNEAKAKALGSNIAHPGDIVVTQRGTLGQVSIIPTTLAYPRYVISQSQMAIAVDSSVADPYYVYYYLRSPTFNGYVANSTIQTGVPHINLGILRDAPALWPTLPEQCAIATTLGSLDDKIELNQRMNETLEVMAQAIFRDWFVDFGPTRRKLNGATDPVTIMGGLVQDTERAQAVADLFPATLGDDGLPEGWAEKQVGEVVVLLKRGLAPSYTDDGILIINQKCIRNNAVNLAAARRHDVAKRLPRDRLLEEYDVVVNSTGVGTLGRVATVRGLKEEATADSHVTICRADTSKVSKLILSLFLEGQEALIETMGHGSTGQTELSPASLSAMALTVAPEPVQLAFDNIVMPLRNLVISSSEQSLTLAEARDLLLPKLMSGEIRLGEAIEAAA